MYPVGWCFAQRKYPAHRLKFMALKWSVYEKFSHWLKGHSFTIWMDNNPLTYYLTNQSLTNVKSAGSLRLHFTPLISKTCLGKEMWSWAAKPLQNALTRGCLRSHILHGPTQCGGRRFSAECFQSQQLVLTPQVSKPPNKQGYVWCIQHQASLSGSEHSV